MTHGRERDAIDDFIDEVKAACDEHHQRFGPRELLFCLRDVPYGRPASPRDPLSVLEAWRGTCSGKHLLARRVLARLSIETTLYCRPYRIDDAVDALPRSVVDRYAGRGLWDVHDYLDAHLAAGPVKIDVTWSRALADAGFPTTLDWDERGDFVIAAPRGDDEPVPDEAGLVAAKEALLDRLNPPAERALRERYVEDLARYADACSTPVNRPASIEGTLRDLRARDHAR